MIFQIGISLCSKRGESSIFKINILKPSWTLRGGIYQGGVLFKVKGKAFETGGENFKSWKCFANSYYLPLTICKRTLKRFYKRICKNKTYVESVVQNVKNEETIHAYLISIYIGSIPSNLALTLCKLVHLCTSIFALVCVGINHQKGGDWKGNRLTPIFLIDFGGWIAQHK
jgi:hypothetical protein